MNRPETFLAIIVVRIDHDKRRIDQILCRKYCLSGSPGLRSSLRELARDITDILKRVIYLYIKPGTNIRDTVANRILKIFLNILTNNKNHMVETCLDRIMHRIVHNNMILCIYRLQLLNSPAET